MLYYIILYYIVLYYIISYVDRRITCGHQRGSVTEKCLALGIYPYVSHMQCVGHPPMPYPSHDSFLRPSCEHSFELSAILPSTFIRLLFPPILPSYDLPAILDSTFLRSFLRASCDPSFDPSFSLRCQASRPNAFAF